MEVEVEALCDQLSLIELEWEEILVEVSPLEEVISKGSYFLLAKFYTSRLYNREAFKQTMRKIWRQEKMIHLHELGSGMLMVKFEDKTDKARVIKESSWNFNKCLILLKEFNGKQQVRNVNITAFFWVRIYDLSLIARNDYIARQDDW